MWLTVKRLRNILRLFTRRLDTRGEPRKRLCVDTLRIRSFLCLIHANRLLVANHRIETDGWTIRARKRTRARCVNRVMCWHENLTSWVTNLAHRPLYQIAFKHWTVQVHINVFTKELLIYCWWKLYSKEGARNPKNMLNPNFLL